MERPVDPYYNGYSGGGGEEGAILAFFGAFLFVGFIFAVAIYVVNAIFLMKLLKNAGHRTPGSAWVPIWNTASLFQIGGIKQPWIWVAVLFGANLVASFIPVIGFLVSLAVVVVAVMLMVWVARGVQAGLGIDSVGGIVLAVIVPLAWIIWMAVVSGKRKYDRNAALMEGGSLPLNWFGDSDRLAPFGAPAYSGYSQQHSGATSQGWAPQGNQPYAAPQASQQSTPASPQTGWSSPQQQGWSTPEAQQSGTEGRESGFPQTPPNPPTPRYEAPLSPREEADGDETDRGGRQL